MDVPDHLVTLCPAKKRKYDGASEMYTPESLSIETTNSAGVYDYIDPAGYVEPKYQKTNLSISQFCNSDIEAINNVDSQQDSTYLEPLKVIPFQPNTCGPPRDFTNKYIGMSSNDKFTHQPAVENKTEHGSEINSIPIHEQFTHQPAAVNKTEYDSETNHITMQGQFTGPQISKATVLVPTSTATFLASNDIKKEETIVSTPDISSFVRIKTEVENNDNQAVECSSAIAETKARNINAKLSKDNDSKSLLEINKHKNEQSSTDYVPKQHATTPVIGCPCKCGCFNELGMEIIKQIFKKFWEIEDYNKQNVYLSELVSSDDVKRSCVQDRTNRTQRRIHYSVTLEDKKYNVCRQAFYSIHGIKEKRMRIIVAKHEKSSVPESSKKTRPTPAPVMISSERRKTVHDHITSFPTLFSRYSKTKTPLIKFLTPGLNINLMYSLYLEWVKAHGKNVKPVSSHCYKVIFGECNFSFDPPLCDTCKICEKSNRQSQGLVGSSDKVSSTESRVLEHLEEAEYVKKLINSYKENSDTTVAAICINLQPALPTPKLSSGIHYYKKKLWIYNFAIHDLKSGRAVVYLWNESVAKRGSAELASCVIQYINTYVDHAVKTFIIFSDNCKGENKHIDMVLTWLQKIHEGRFHHVEHIFTVPGHTDLPCDRDYGNIERKIRPVEVCSQDNYAKLIQNCRNPRKYEVFHMSRSRFLNISLLQTTVDKKQLYGAGFKDGKIFLFTSAYKQGFGIKATYQQADPFYIQLQRNMSATYDPHTFDLSRMNIPLKYSGPLRVAHDKISDLKELLTYVQAHQKQFLACLISEQESMVNTIYIQDDYASDDDFIDY